MMRALAKAGFTQSYTYFTWRNSKQELTDYVTELAQGPAKEYLRPNFFTNTPDILPLLLQQGGRPAFRIRLVLAATLAPSYGIYNGFELCEARALPDSEEYLDSEKYEYKVWDWDRPGHIKDDIARINRIRRDNPALHRLDTLRFHPADDDAVLFYGKTSEDGADHLFIAVNLDPVRVHEAEIELPLAELGIPEDETFTALELLTGRAHRWRGARQQLASIPASTRRRSSASRGERRLSPCPVPPCLTPRPLFRPSRSSPIRSGTRTRSSISCTSRRSSTPTTTASAISRG